jgi:hypothetical protein
MLRKDEGYLRTSPVIALGGGVTDAARRQGVVAAMT